MELLDAARDQGFDQQLTAQDDGRVRCVNCGSLLAAGYLTAQHVERLEGASDAADELILAHIRCPVCHEGGVLTLGYGPNASTGDDAVLQRLSLDPDAHDLQQR